MTRTISDAIREAIEAYPFSGRTPIPVLRDAAKYLGKDDHPWIQAAAMNWLRILDQIAPTGEPFVWGTVTTWHRVGDYVIAESHKDTPYWYGGREVQPEEHPEPSFHGWVDAKDTRHSHASLDDALAFCIAYKAEGPNTRAHTYFIRSLKSERSAV